MTHNPSTTGDTRSAGDHVVLAIVLWALLAAVCAVMVNVIAR